MALPIELKIIFYFQDINRFLKTLLIAFKMQGFFEWIGMFIIKIKNVHVLEIN